MAAVNCYYVALAISGAPKKCFGPFSERSIADDVRVAVIEAIDNPGVAVSIEVENFNQDFSFDCGSKHVTIEV